MRTIDLDALKASDIPHILDAVNRHLLEQGLYAITDNIFVRPEVLAKRWELSLSCLSHWRFTGGGPLFMKTGPGPKAKVRYPLLGRNGVLDFESQRLYGSTAEETASRQKPLNLNNVNRIT